MFRNIEMRGLKFEVLEAKKLMTSDLGFAPLGVDQQVEVACDDIDTFRIEDATNPLHTGIMGADIYGGY